MFLNSGFVEPEKKMAERSLILRREVELVMQHGSDRYGSSGSEVGNHWACPTSLLGLCRHHTVKHFCLLGLLALLREITGEPGTCTGSPRHTHPCTPLPLSNNKTDQMKDGSFSGVSLQERFSWSMLPCSYLWFLLPLEATLWYRRSVLQPEAMWMSMTLD